MNFAEALRYCRMCGRRSPAARNLTKKVGKNHKLTTAQIELIYKFAKEMKDIVGEREVILYCDKTNLPLQIDQTFLSDSVLLVSKGKWLADELSSTVVGEWIDQDLVKVFPNSVLLVSELEAVLA